jgi:hypothetical protein
MEAVSVLVFLKEITFNTFGAGISLTVFAYTLFANNGRIVIHTDHTAFRLRLFYYRLLCSGSLGLGFISLSYA